MIEDLYLLSVLKKGLPRLVKKLLLVLFVFLRLSFLHDNILILITKTS